MGHLIGIDQCPTDYVINRSAIRIRPVPFLDDLIVLMCLREFGRLVSCIKHIDDDCVDVIYNAEESAIMATNYVNRVDYVLIFYCLRCESFAVR